MGCENRRPTFPAARPPSFVATTLSASWSFCGVSHAAWLGSFHSDQRSTRAPFISAATVDWVLGLVDDELDLGDQPLDLDRGNRAVESIAGAQGLAFGLATQALHLRGRYASIVRGGTIRLGG